MPFLLHGRSRFEDSEGRSLQDNGFDPRACARFGVPCSTPVAAARRPTLIRAMCRMCKTAVCGCVHAAHDNRCLPGEGREVKPRHSDAVEAWRAALTERTPARENTSRAPVGLARQPHRFHPAPLPQESHEIA